MSIDTPTGQEPTAPASTELPNGAAAAPPDGVAASAEPAAPEATPAEGEGTEQTAQPQQPSRKDMRFADLTKERNKAREEAAYWRGIAEAARMGQNAPKPPSSEAPPAAPADPEPDPAAFAGKEWDPAYLREVARWEGRQEARRLAEETKQSQARETEAQAAHREFEEGRQRFIEARDIQAREIEEQFPQYAGAVTETLDNIARMEPPRTPGRLIDIVTLAENPAWVAAALATKSGLLQQIAGLSPERRALAIGKIDAQISANLANAQTAPRPAPTPAPSAAAAPSNPNPAPTPPPTINGRGAVPSIDPNKANMDDYKRWREAQEGQPH